MSPLPAVSPSEMSAYPTISFPEIYHVGSFQSADKRPGSYEGAGLSISLHPEEWTEIADLGGEPTWRLTRANNGFLAAHELSRRIQREILEWAVKRQYAESCNIYRWRYIDADTDSPCDCFFLTQAEADAESLWDAEPDNGPNGTVRAMDGHKSTPTLDTLTAQTSPAIGTDFVLDLLLPLYADEVLDLDGVWWADRYDPSALSAPRGVIVPSKIALWDRVKIAEPCSRYRAS